LKVSERGPLRSATRGANGFLRDDPVHEYEEAPFKGTFLSGKPLPEQGFFLELKLDSNGLVW
jgi:hypothetical protein